MIKTQSIAEKPRKRAIALRCVVGGGPWVFGDHYLAIAGHRGGDITWFDVMIDGEMRTVPDDRFAPANPENWPLFSISHRMRFGRESFQRHAA